MNISLKELSTLDEMILGFNDTIEVVEDLLQGELGDFMEGRVDNYLTADELLNDLNHLNNSKLLLLRLLNESKLKI